MLLNKSRYSYLNNAKTVMQNDLFSVNHSTIYKSQDLKTTKVCTTDEKIKNYSTYT